MDVERIKEIIERMDTHLRAANGQEDGARRAKIIERAVELRNEIRGIFSDVEHWNNAVRQPGEEPLDADPDGLLRALLVKLDAQIAAWVQ